jgi:hypothetical protein
MYELLIGGGPRQELYYRMFGRIAPLSTLRHRGADLIHKIRIKGDIGYVAVYDL